MRDLKIIFFSILIMIGNTPTWAINAEKYSTINEDIIVLNTGKTLKGHIVKFGSNSFKLTTINGEIKVPNNEVVLVGIGQDMSDMEKFRLGQLDGKRYAKNKFGNLAVGFFFGLLGTAAVYLTSEQAPSFEAMAGPNKTIVNDANYIMGYEKGAKSKSGRQALIGAIAWLTLVIIAISSAAASIDDGY